MSQEPEAQPGWSKARVVERSEWATGLITLGLDVEPSFEAGEHASSEIRDVHPADERNEPDPGAADHSEAAHSESTEYGLMAISIAVAFIGIGLAWYFFVSHPSAADRVAESAAPVHDLLLHKYYVDELYDAAIVQPIVGFSRGALWKIVDAELIDGAVNGAGAFVSTSAGLLRRLQTGSVRVYAASLTLGVVLVLGFYLWRLSQGASF